ncbi:MAG: hypothetical protein VKN72_28360 [Nostocales cyanobacterium 94392]|nr:hypothetical protein [Nostocales cyanobacterium 94392]
MKRKKLRLFTNSLVISATICSMFVGMAIAQSARSLNANLVPVKGKTVQNFVPKGWTIQDKVEGDINRDEKPDTVLTLIEAGTQSERGRALVILIKQANGNLQRLAVANKLLLCSSCAGVLSSPDGAGTNIEIKSGVITVSQLSGSRLATETLHRFWIDKSSQRLVLIGKDITDFDRANGDSTVTSESYLTGQQIVQTFRSQKLVSTKKSPIPKSKQLIENVSI